MSLFACSYATKYDCTSGFLRLYHSHPIFTHSFSPFKSWRWLKALRSKMAWWYLFTYSLRDLFFPYLIFISSIMSSSKAITPRDYSANSWGICSKRQMLPQGNFRYHSHARPSKVNENAQHLKAYVKPCTPIILLKRSIYTKWFLLPVCLRSKN